MQSDFATYHVVDGVALPIFEMLMKPNGKRLLSGFE
jgi:hypothetical protein